MIILGIDPGYATVGYGVVEAQSGRFRPLEYGAVVTEAELAFGLRLEKIYDSLSEVAQRWKPEAVSVEKLYFTNNRTTAIGVAEARGVILLAAHKAGAEIFEYTPLQIKLSVTGYGQAKKPQVMEMTRKLLCLRDLPKPDDTADALAMAVCHGQAAGSPLRRAMLAGRLGKADGGKDGKSCFTV